MSRGKKYEGERPIMQISSFVVEMEDRRLIYCI